MELFVNGNTTSEIMKTLGIRKERCMFVYRTGYRRHRDRSRSGRPISVTTQRMKNIIRCRIRRNPRRSIRKMSTELGISRTSVTYIVRKDLGLSSFKLRKVQFLTDTMKLKRKLRSRGLLSRFAGDGLNNVLFSDEKLFTIEQAFNRQNDRVLSSNTSTIPETLHYVRRTQKPLSVMVWAGISAVGRIPLVFVPQGVKINSNTYRELVLEP